MPSAISRLFQSRKFLILLLDVLIALISLLLTELAAPDLTTLVMTLIGIVQPVVLAVIAAIAIEDAAAKRNGNFPGEFKK